MTAHSAGSDGTTYDPNDDWPDKAKGAPAPMPNVEDMRAHLELLFGGDRCVGMLDGQVEISWTDIYGSVKYAEMFGLHELDEAADYAAERNRKRGVNVFVSAALRTKDAPPGKRAGKEFVLGMTAVPVDWDKPGTGDPASVKEKTAFLPPNFIVVTGRHPDWRSHGWWVLDEPLMGVSPIEALMKPMAHSLDGDTGVVNADRVMRLAGSVAWPHKPGRIREQTKLVTRFKADGDKPRPPSYNTDRVVRTFQARWTEEPAGASPAGSGPSPDDPHAKNPFTGRFDPMALLRSIRPGNWYTPMRDFVAHMVGRGRQDWEILLMTAPYCEPGHQGITVQDLIDSARAKYNKPNPADPSDEFDFSQNPPAPLRPQSAAAIVIEQLDRRPWLFGEWLQKGIVSMLVGPGGQGKSILSIHMALAYAAGREWAGQKTKERGGVWIWNNEDDLTELHRRIGGTAKHMGINLKDLDGKLFANSGVRSKDGESRRLVVAVPGEHGAVIATPDVRAIIDFIRENDIKVFIIDPMVSIHYINENDNGAMQKVMDILLTIAVEAECSVVVVHHTAKPGSNTVQAGNQDISRGATSVPGASRMLLTVTRMTEDDAEFKMGQGYDEKRRKRCIRIDTGKANQSAPGDDTIFLEKVSVSLGNGSGTRIEDDADQIGGLVVADFSEAQQEVMQRHQEKQDRLLRRVYDAMHSIPAPGEMRLKELVARIEMETIEFGRSRALRDHIDAVLPMASAGSVRVGEFVYYRRQDGAHEKATIYVCKREAV